MPHPDQNRRPIAALHAVSVTRSGEPVFAGLDLDVHHGELLTVVGPSGVGKSTLLSLLAGLLQPGSGTVSRPEDDGGSTRLVFQQPRLLPWRTAAENVRLGLEFRANGGHGLGHAHDADARVTRLLAELGIADLAERMPEELSGGQAQRVAIARAVAADPSLLLLDEPFSALDAFTRRNLQKDVRAIARDLGLTLVLVTHDVGEAVRMADRVIVLRANPGRVAEDTRIELSEEERAGGSEGFQREHSRLMGIYSRVADAPGADAEIANDFTQL